MNGLKPVAALSGTDVELYRKVLAHHIAVFNFRTLVAGCVTMTVLVGFTLYLSHKIAGPMVTLRRFFTEIKEGKTPRPLNFRDRDFLMDIPPLVNDAIATLKEREKSGSKKSLTG